MSIHYLREALNHIPSGILCAQDYEVLAQQFISAPAYAYVTGGSEHDITLNSNREAFKRYSMVPRVLCDVSSASTRCRLLGKDMSHPILLAPVAFQKLVHPMGEVATARAAEATDTCFVTSTLSSCSMEDIAAASGGARWFQLYFQPSRANTLNLVRRAEAAGYSAIVVTLDAAVQTASFQAHRAGFSMPDDIRTPNLDSFASTDNKFSSNKNSQSRIFGAYMLHAPLRGDIEWLLQESTLPVLVKGVLHPGDAQMLKSMGVAGCVVSNHGGRSLDGVQASLTQLVAIREATGDSFTVLLDSGIRSGSDIFKALALGADAVLIGRLQVYALAVAGALGVAHMIKLLREELELCMAYSGCITSEDIRKTSTVAVY
jgi:isopentenyl diphosphate isomerase/L-lactate dehydrogenase-like FMN-dependent dehydrogenase